MIKENEYQTLIYKNQDGFFKVVSMSTRKEAVSPISADIWAFPPFDPTTVHVKRRQMDKTSPNYTKEKNVEYYWTKDKCSWTQER